MSEDIIYNTGVYKIVNKVNGKVYVGGAYKSFEKRFEIHRRDLENGNHINKHLLSAWNKYGATAFIFEIIERHHTDGLKERETYWIAFYDATNREKGYNRSPTGGSPLGTKHPPEYGRAVSERNKARSPEINKKIGLSRRGKLQTIEAKKRIGIASKERWKSNEHREKITRYWEGRVLSDDHKRKISSALKGRKLSPDHIEKIRINNTGKKLSKEHIEAIRKKNIGKKMPKEAIERTRQANLGSKRSSETIEKLKIAQRKRFENPEQKAKMALINKGRKWSEERKRAHAAIQNRPETKALKSQKAKEQAERRRQKQYEEFLRLAERGELKRITKQVDPLEGAGS